MPYHLPIRKMMKENTALFYTAKNQYLARQIKYMSFVFNRSAVYRAPIRLRNQACNGKGTLLQISGSLYDVIS